MKLCVDGGVVCLAFVSASRSIVQLHALPSAVCELESRNALHGDDNG